MNLDDIKNTINKIQCCRKEAEEIYNNIKHYHLMDAKITFYLKSKGNSGSTGGSITFDDKLALKLYKETADDLTRKAEKLETQLYVSMRINKTKTGVMIWKKNIN